MSGPLRVVSLCPSLTETVASLGAGASLVGRTRFCVAPRALVERVAVVGGTKDPDVARVVALAPDLVLMNAEENRREDALALEAAGLRVHASLPRTPDEVPELVLDLGRLLAREEEARALAAGIERALAEARAAVAGRPPVPFLVLVWRRPWMAAGRDTYLGALLERAGGVNVLAATEARYPTLAPGALAALRPARVLLPSEPFRFRAGHRAEVAELLGVPLASVRLADGAALTWHGARTAAGLAHARALLAD